MKSKSTAVLLAFFLGGLGIHHFYLKTGKGLIYLIFCWSFIPAIIAFFESIILLFQSQSDFDRKYNTPVESIAMQAVNYNLANKPNRSGKVADEIQKLHNLLELGILTQEEFDKQKSKLI